MSPQGQPQRAGGHRSIALTQRNALRVRLHFAGDSAGRTIWIADAQRGNWKRFVVHADEKLTAFMELERAIQEFAVSLVW